MGGGAKGLWNDRRDNQRTRVPIVTGVRALEHSYKIKVVILVVCTTGITQDAVRLIKQHADIVWSCASQSVRNEIGAQVVFQLSKLIPVFVMTRNGIDFVAAYSQQPVIIKNLSFGKQFVVSNEPGSQRIRLGDFEVFIHKKRINSIG